MPYLTGGCCQPGIRTKERTSAALPELKRLKGRPVIARSRVTFVLAVLVGGAVLAAQVPAAVSFLPIDEVRPGMVGVGRTVFQGDTLEEFRVDIVGVLRNVMGPQRDLVLARLDGGPLANAGVIQGMSGSPVYVDGRLLGASRTRLDPFRKKRWPASRRSRK